ncbi:hypothetical protein CANARDRAFT_27319 [[Candida] arabinofermentans NRRL YB-2248]|uniref:Bul1 N-terminal domain-containing protein n=1 Tax=[Candida] arabinofermentans NRRL YB-2248 TaxID=983967 RepID=A0A1E4T5H7_9ASCO|nr:hypothetical protein CANARDRAFT_27319 [[Candida] arabinofermentans NRRL YB-2248]
MSSSSSHNKHNGRGGVTSSTVGQENELCQCDNCMDYRPQNLTPLPNEQTSYFVSKNDEVLVLEDILPTFQIHNNLLNRTLSQLESEKSDLPDYDTALRESYISHNPSGTSSQNIPNTSTAPATTVMSESTTMNSSNEETANRAQYAHDKENLILDHLDRLQKINSPLRVSISITKVYPEMSTPLQKVNPLREFQPGDTVTGSILVENNSDVAIPFEMFLVSLEGFITVPVAGKKLVRSTFLKMFDFGACYHEGYIPTTNVKTPWFLKTDSLDGSTYGFPESRIIEPGSKHKKFFHFRLPETLLDQSCEHQMTEHFEKLPPSFGVDQECFNNRGHEIEMNELLGYGRLQQFGSPLLLNDQNERGKSISYAVCARLIGKKREVYKEFYQKDTSHDYKFIMIKECQSFIRLVPAERAPLPSYSPTVSDSTIDKPKTKEEENAKEMEPPPVYKRPSTNVQLAKISKIAQETSKRLRQRKELMSIGVQDDTELNDLTLDVIDYANYSITQGDDKKRTQLRLNTVSQPTLTSQSNTIISEVLIPLKAKKKTFSFSSSKSEEEVGVLSFNTRLDNNKKLEYIVPKVLRKIAQDNSSTDLNQVPLSFPLSPISSPMVMGGSSYFNDLRPVESMSSIVSRTSEMDLGTVLSNGANNDSALSTDSTNPYLNELEIELEYIPPSTASKNFKPPEISAVKPMLKSFTISSPYPIPITLDSDLFLSTAEKSTHTLVNIKQKFSDHLMELKTLAKDTGKGIDRRLFYDLLSISNLELLEKNLPIFKDFVIKEQPKWKLTQGLDNKVSYRTKFKIKLVWDQNSIKNLTLLPSFMSCHFYRFYFINLSLSLKKTSTSGVSLNVPVEVAKYSLDI